jgi:ADP-ribose pyrophosphatase YjhB (NUDIX family)
LANTRKPSSNCRRQTVKEVLSRYRASSALGKEDDFYLQWCRVLHVPGGGCGGQRPCDAALRELEEETGLVAGTVHALGVIDPLPAVTAARTHLFLATDLRTGMITEAGSVAALLLAAHRHT